MNNYQIEISTNIGNEKNENKDNFFANGIIRKKNNQYNSFECNVQEFLILGIFDGMSGGENGEIASRLLSNEFLKNKKKENEKIEDYIKNILQEVNNRFRKVCQEKIFSGTTAALIVFNNKNYYKVFSIGDSRAYIASEDKGLIQLTKDDTVGQLLVDIGVYDDLDNAEEYEKSALTNYVGIDQTGRELFVSESEWKKLEENQKILLCSDGLTKMCLEKEIYDIIMKNERGIAKKLNHAALKQGGYDNITSIVIQRIKEKRVCQS